VSDKFDQAAPLPQRDPFATMADWGRTDEIPPPDDLIPWGSPGRPPWAPPEKAPLPAWAWVSIILGTVFLLCTGAITMAMVDENGPTPAVRVESVAEVSTTGTCEKRIIGKYGLVATITARNATSDVQSGTVWVSWPVTGSKAQEFSQRLTLDPGQATEFPVNQEVTPEMWFATGECTYGWRPE
jgi:hypothetical protein